MFQEKEKQNKPFYHFIYFDWDDNQNTESNYCNIVSPSVWNAGIALRQAYIIFEVNESWY